MITFNTAMFLPDSLQIVLRDSDGFTAVIEGKKHMVKKMGPRLPPKTECPDCQGFGEVGMSGDICRSCAGIGYTYANPAPKKS